MWSSQSGPTSTLRTAPPVSECVVCVCVCVCVGVCACVGVSVGVSVHISNRLDNHSRQEGKVNNLSTTLKISR